MDENIFRIDWGTGKADLKISAFFTSAKAVQLKKFCKLAKRHCSDTERTELLIALAYEDKARKCLLSKLEMLSRERAKLIGEFYHIQSTPEGWAEKQIKRERAQLKKAIDTLNAQRWNE